MIKVMNNLEYTKKEYDVIIIGAGPAGIFAADQILCNTEKASVLLIDKGKAPEERNCRAGENGCINCRVCDVLCGGGGAGLFSDGKLILDLNSGGILERGFLSENEKKKTVEFIKGRLLSFDGNSDIQPQLSNDEIIKLKRVFASDGLEIKPYDVIHMGTHNLRNITNNFLSYLKKKYQDRITIIFECEALEVSKGNNIFKVLSDNKIYTSKYLVLAVGKTGSEWLKKVISNKRNFVSNNYFFGVRLETFMKYTSKLVDLLYDPKIYKYFDNDKKIKIHCVCRNGNIRLSRYNKYVVAGGHTEYTKYKKDQDAGLQRCNFNILLSIGKGDILPDKVLDSFYDVSKNKLLVQTLGDFRNNKKTVKFGSIKPINTFIVEPANIRRLLNSVDNYPEKMLDFLDSLNNYLPGINGNDNLLYGPSIEWWMDTIQVDPDMQTTVKNLFAIGDGAGLSQGIIHAAATGILSGRKIVKEIETTNEIRTKLLLEKC